MTMQSLAAQPQSVASLEWGNDRVRLVFRWDAGSPVVCGAIAVDGGDALRLHKIPAVEIMTAAAGHLPASSRLVHGRLGAALRYVGNVEHRDGGVRTLQIRQRAGEIEAVLHLQVREGVAAVRSWVVVTNTGTDPIVLRSVASWSAGFTDPDASDALEGWERWEGRSDWLGEGRWAVSSLRGPDFVPLAEHLTGHNPRGALVATSQGTWSTARSLPTGVLASSTVGRGLAWQIEHNGAWRWEIGEDTGGAYLALAGPTDADAAWTHVLAPAQSFESVPVAVAYAHDGLGAIHALTDHRRSTRRAHPDNIGMPVVFNDYMNTLNGDPTTDKLLPLIDAAAEVGAEVFCIDAGWYDDSGHWWDSVGEWKPSRTRFPGGLGEVVDRIRKRGMVPGLWLEPEVVGVRSPIADTLPNEAFLQRHGMRLVEHDRYHLDLRHPAARLHLDSVIDRLVAEFGVGFFKMDYNINPGAGTDLDSHSVGDGLLEHNRAHLAWLDGVLDRHPGLVLENCSSGAMRMDYALLSRLAMQSTSDQQDFLKYPAIAAAAPISLLPEQAASWAYPQPEMTEEEASFCLVTGLLGRFYVSGHLNAMDPRQRERVADAITVAKQLRSHIASAYPHWPAGLPRWNDEWVSLALRGADAELVCIWRRGGPTDTTLSFPHLAGVDVEVRHVYPVDLPEWGARWDSSTGTLHVRADDTRVAARTLRLTPIPQGTA